MRSTFKINGMEIEDVEKLRKKNRHLKSLIWEHYRMFKEKILQMQSDNENLRCQIFDEKQKHTEIVEQYSRRISLLEAELRNIRSYAPRPSQRKRISIRDPKWKLDDLEEEGNFLLKEAEAIFERAQNPKEMLKKAQMQLAKRKEPIRLNTDDSSSSAADLLAKYDMSSTSEEINPESAAQNHHINNKDGIDKQKLEQNEQLEISSSKQDKTISSISTSSLIVQQQNTTTEAETTTYSTIYDNEFSNKFDPENNYSDVNRESTRDSPYIQKEKNNTTSEKELISQEKESSYYSYEYEEDQNNSGIYAASKDSNVVSTIKVEKADNIEEEEEVHEELQEEEEIPEEIHKEEEETEEEKEVQEDLSEEEEITEDIKHGISKNESKNDSSSGLKDGIQNDDCTKSDENILISNINQNSNTKTSVDEKESQKEEGELSINHSNSSGDNILIVDSTLKDPNKPILTNEASNKDDEKNDINKKLISDSTESGEMSKILLNSDEVDSDTIDDDYSVNHSSKSSDVNKAFYSIDNKGYDENEEEDYYYEEEEEEEEADDEDYHNDYGNKNEDIPVKSTVEISTVKPMQSSSITIGSTSQITNNNTSLFGRNQIDSISDSASISEGNIFISAAEENDIKPNLTLSPPSNAMSTPGDSLAISSSEGSDDGLYGRFDDDSEIVFN